MELNLDYLAGFTDADGCIGMQKTIRGGRFKSPEYKCRVSISNTNERIIKKIKILCDKNLCNGSIQVSKRLKTYHRNEYIIHFYNQNAYRLCKLLKTKLLIKKRNSEIVIIFYEKRINNTSPLSKEELARREKLYLKKQKY